MTYTFRFPIGDWSRDGHGDCNWYKVQSNKPVQLVRESYFEITQRLGTGLDSQFADAPCSDYEDRTISLEWLKKVGISPDALVGIDDYDPEDGVMETWQSETIAELFILFMNKHDPSLDLKIVDDKDDMFTFYGMDEKGRHIGNMGYGVTGNY